MVRIFLIGITILLSGCFCEKNITSIQSFKQVNFSDINDDTLVVFDIDFTLIKPHLSTGTFNTNKDKWKKIFNEYKEKLIAQLGKKQAEEYLHYCFSICDRDQEEIIIEPCIINILADLKKRDIRTIACTYAPSGKNGVMDNVAENRYRVLKKLGIEFDWSYIGISLKLNTGSQNKHPVFIKGICCTDGESKGASLLAFFRQTGYVPKIVIFFDDTLKRLKDVEDMCNAQGIVFQGYHYEPHEDAIWDEHLVRFKIESLIKHKMWFKNDEVAREHLKRSSKPVK